MGMSHVRTSPFYPQSNGKLERYHKTIKAECIRPKVALSLEDARKQKRLEKRNSIETLKTRTISNNVNQLTLPTQFSSSN